MFKKLTLLLIFLFAISGVSAINWDSTLDGSALPTSPWQECDEINPPENCMDGASLVSGQIQITTADALATFYAIQDTAIDSTQGTTIEAKITVVDGSQAMLIYDATTHYAGWFWIDSSGIYLTDWSSLDGILVSDTTIDTTVQHTYRLVLKGDVVSLYVDNNPAPTLTVDAPDTDVGAPSMAIFGEPVPDAPLAGTVLWDDVKFYKLSDKVPPITWTTEYDGAVEPQTDGWGTEVTGGGFVDQASSSGGILTITGVASVGDTLYDMEDTSIDFDKGFSMLTRAKLDSSSGDTSMVVLGVGDNVNGIVVELTNSNTLTAYDLNYEVSQGSATVDTTSYHLYRLTVKGTHYDVYVDEDETPVLSGTLPLGVTPGNPIVVFGFLNDENDGTGSYDYVSFSNEAAEGPTAYVPRLFSVSGYEVTDISGTEVTSKVADMTLQLRTTGGAKKVEFSVDDDSDLSGVSISADSEKTVLTGLTSSVRGITGSHSLYIPNVNNAGVFVCPGATSLGEVISGCASEVNFEHSDCDGLTPIGGLICDVINGDYKISGLTTSGAGNNPGAGPGAVPEFSDYALMAAIGLGILGVFLIRKRK